jgi:hypothetical protein
MSLTDFSNTYFNEVFGSQYGFTDGKLPSVFPTYLLDKISSRVTFSDVLGQTQKYDLKIHNYMPNNDIIIKSANEPNILFLSMLALLTFLTKSYYQKVQSTRRTLTDWQVPSNRRQSSTNSELTYCGSIRFSPVLH